MNINEAIEKGRELDVYLDSEMADKESHLLDDLWQSIYDVVNLGCGGIIESDPRELEEAIFWLKDTQELTNDYKDMEIDFKV